MRADRFLSRRALALGCLAGLITGVTAAGPTYADTTDAETWVLHATTSRPDADSGGAMAYDAARGETVHFGGLDNGWSDDSTWIWNGVVWERRALTGDPPSRWGAAMTYDAAREEVVLFGGVGDFGYRSSTTWYWDGSDWGIHGGGLTRPSPREGAVMAFDDARDQVVLFGGYNYDSDTHFADTWTWDGVEWTQRAPATSPPPRAHAAIAYDAARRETVLFGGGNDSGALTDTWIWDGTTWAQRASATSPPAGSGVAMAYDAARRDVVLVDDGTWTWDGTAWAERMPAVGPDTVEAVAYDAARGHVVAYTGAETWTFRRVGAVSDAEGHPSDDCAGGTTLADGFAGGAYVRVVVVRPDPATTWVCARFDGPSLSFGGRFTVLDPAARAPGPPTADADTDACADAPANLVPGPHPIQSGSVGDPSEPATYLPFLVDAYASTGQAWICLYAGAIRQRVVVPASFGLIPPAVVFTPDLPGAHVPAPDTSELPSGRCQAGGGESGRLVDATVADLAAALYAWRPTESVVELCVRVEGAAGVGGALRVDTGSAGGATPSVTTSTTDLAPCSLSVASLATPPVEVRRSAADDPTVSICVTVGATRLRVSAAPGDGQSLADVTWTPDPGTPG